MGELVQQVRVACRRGRGGSLLTPTSSRFRNNRVRKQGINRRFNNDYGAPISHPQYLPYFASRSETRSTLHVFRIISFIKKFFASFCIISHQYFRFASAGQIGDGIWQQGQDSGESRAGDKCVLGQDSWDRIAGTGQLERRFRKETMGGKRRQDGQRTWQGRTTGGARQPKQDSHGRIAGAWQSVLDTFRRIAGIGQFGLVSLKGKPGQISLDRIDRRGWSEHDS